MPGSKSDQPGISGALVSGIPKAPPAPAIIPCSPSGDEPNAGAIPLSDAPNAVAEDNAAISGADRPNPPGSSKAGASKAGIPAVSSCNTAKFSSNAANCPGPNGGRPPASDMPPILGPEKPAAKDKSPMGATSGGVKPKSSEASNAPNVARFPIANDHSGGVRSSVGISSCDNESHNPPNASQPPGNCRSIPSAPTATSNRAAIASSRATAGN